MGGVPGTDYFPLARNLDLDNHDVLNVGTISAADIAVVDLAVSGTLKADTINEYTGGVGVNVEGVILEDGNITMPDDTWIGLAAAGGRIEFNSTPAPDTLSFLDCNVVMDNSLSVDTIDEYTGAAGVTIDGVIIKDNGIDIPGTLKVDTIDEYTGGVGVTIDSVLLKDNDVKATSFTIGGNTLDTTEWANLDGLDQALKQADSPTFGGLTLNGNVTVADNVTIGLAAGGHIEFDNQATDEINFISCFVGINTSAPATALDVKLRSDADKFRIQRASGTGRAQFVLATEAAAEVWRCGMTGAGITTFSFYDQTQTVLSMAQNGDVTFSPGGDILLSASVGINLVAPGSVLDIQATSTTDYVMIRRSEAAGRAQIYFADEAGAQIWRAGLVAGGSTSFVLYDETQNVVSFAQNGDIVFNPGGNVVMTGVKQIQYRDAQIHTASLTDGHLDHTADVSIDLNTPRTYVSGTLGIGTETVSHGGVGYAMLAMEGADTNAAGPHVQFTTASNDYPLLHMLMWAHDNVSLLFDAYYDGDFKSSDAGSNFAIYKLSDQLLFRYDAGIAAGSELTWANSFLVRNTGHVLVVGTNQVQFNDADVNISSPADSIGALQADGYWRVGAGTPTQAMGANGDFFVSGLFEVDGNARFDGWVGIGTAPLTNYSLSIAGGTGVDPGATYLIGQLTTIDPTYTAAAARINRAGSFVTSWDGAKNGQNVDNYALFAQLLAYQASRINYGAYVEILARGATAGTVSYGTGVYSAVTSEHANKTIGVARAVYAAINETAGTITTSYLFSGAVTGTPGTNWGIYLTGETKNYFSGDVGIGDTTPSYTLDVNGTGRFVGALQFDAGLTVEQLTVVGVTTLSAAHYIVLCDTDTAGAAFTITLPAAASHAGRVYYIKNTGGGGFDVTVDANGAETIDDDLTQAVIDKNCLAIVCDGTEWWVI